MIDFKLTADAEGLLRQVGQQITDKCERYCQLDWCENGHCGTIMCFAGWVCWLRGWVVCTDGLARKNLRKGPSIAHCIESAAMQELGINSISIATKLFCPDAQTNGLVSQEVVMQMYHGLTGKGRAKAGVEFLNAFIKKYT